MADIASALGNVAVGRRVVDQTEVSGAFDFELRWTPVTTRATPDAQANEQASIFAAVQEQLGLKLVTGRGPVDVLVIDHIERPTQN
jgi:bla regulator protein BlaR1